MNAASASPSAALADQASRAATVAAFAMIANQVGGKAARDALFLTTFSIEALPIMVIAAAAGSIVTAVLASRLLTRHGPARVVPAAFAVSGCTLLLIWPLYRLSAAAGSVALYLQFSIAGSVLVSWFWSVINERFDPRTARRRVARIAAGGSLGGVVGGLLAACVATIEGIPMLAVVPMLALLHLICAVAVARISPDGGDVGSVGSVGSVEPAEPPPPLDAGVVKLRRNPYLMQLALIVLTTTVAATLIDFLFKSLAAQRFSEGEALLQFFALFYTVTGLVTFAAQSALARRSLETLGLAGTVSTLPAAVGLGAMVLAIPSLFGIVSATLVRGAEAVLRSSLYRSAYELFYTPVATTEKRAAKTLIDVGFERIGDAVGGGLVQLVFFIAAVATAGGAAHSQFELRALVLLATLLSVAALVIARRLDRGYVAALESSLRRRAVVLDLDDVVDSQTRTIYFRAVAGARPAPASERSNDPVAAGTGGRGTDPVQRRIRDLTSGDPGRARAALAELKPPVEDDLLPHALRLLGWDEVSEDAIRALRGLCDLQAQPFIDALLDPDEEFVVRRRLPRVLSAGSSEAIVNGLVQGLRDPRFEVRYHSSAALARIHSRRAELLGTLGQPFRDAVLEAVVREASVDRRVWESRGVLDALDRNDEAPFVDEVLRRRSTLSLEHVFTMLALVYPEQPLRIAYLGLHTDDASLRGTALEYLDSLLPARLRENLWPLLQDGAGQTVAVRPQGEALASLLRSHESIRKNLEVVSVQRKRDS